MSTKMKLVIPAVLILLGLVTNAVEGGKKRNWLRQRGCRRPAADWLNAQGEGEHFVWTRSGLGSDNLRVTYREGAFAPTGDAPVVHTYPRDNEPLSLELFPASLFYDFSEPEHPRTAIRVSKKGRGMCIVLTSDVNSHAEMMTQLRERNLTNLENEDHSAVRSVRVRYAEDPDALTTAALRQACSQDKCGNPVQAHYFVESGEEEVEEEEEEELADEESSPGAPQNRRRRPMMHRAVVLFNDRVVISGMPTRGQWRRGRLGSAESRQRARQGRRQQRRQGRRQQRRQQRRERRRQSRPSVSDQEK